MAQEQAATSPTAQHALSRRATADSRVTLRRPPFWSRQGTAILGFLFSWLGHSNPLVHPADPHKNTVWLLDNTAFRLQSDSEDSSGTSQSWQAEFVACIFETHGRKDVGKVVATIADYIGIDGNLGSDGRAMRERIEQRVQPFLNQISPGRTLKLQIPVDGETQSHALGDSDENGIISQTVDLGALGVADGATIRPAAQGFTEPTAVMETRFAAPEGWMVISDIDDTIKRTMTRDPTGILRTTFAEEPVAIAGMPDLYRQIQKDLDPTWFYLSASPYNLYPFLHQFVHEHYVPGTIILRDYSWMDIGGLIKSFTEKTQEYKVDRMEKVHSWFPRRRVLCIGDSTQSDPEAYAEIYARYPGWIHAIAIRRVTDVENMEEKNKPERFETAFKDVPSSVWTVFEKADELDRVIAHLESTN
ncbi:hypothetical protein N7539_007239 [Penicillium diatomitis]|uniref:Phosphatidate phosphatase APP1 catalytic domain-containing protein n=1 Tax=Penicillium diatomitis TaxID=2819901 RepID=A0A9X0BNP9_9EURO|nr:uncharacterized protein N7539_007239 [Penicillium diatomitis]KAJ5477095.1 hypothetical protein N7539_007239 [Penicillium diatomitis]